MVVVTKLQKLFFLLQIIMKLVLNGLNENYKVIWILELMQDSQKEPSLKNAYFQNHFDPLCKMDQSVILTMDRFRFECVLELDMSIFSQFKYNKIFIDSNIESFGSSC